MMKLKRPTTRHFIVLLTLLLLLLLICFQNCANIKLNGRKLASKPPILKPRGPSGNASKPLVITKLVAGQSHSCAMYDHKVSCWGNNSAGQVGNGSTADVSRATDLTLQNVTDIATGDNHTCAVSGGDVYCWGDNSHGQLGMSPVATLNTLTALKVSGLTTATNIFAGKNYSCASLQNKSLYCWGQIPLPIAGEFGMGTLHSSPVQVSGITEIVQNMSVGYGHVCVSVVGGNGLKCWGNDTWGELGRNLISVTPLLVDAVAGISEKVMHIVSSDYHTCVSTESNKLNCWGDNQTGALADNALEISSTPVVVASLSEKVNDMSMSSGGVCLALQSGTLCWGSAIPFADPQGRTLSVEKPGYLSTDAAKFVAVGSHHICIATVDGRVLCWGENDHQQLGDGTPSDPTYPISEVTGFNPE